MRTEEPDELLHGAKTLFTSERRLRQPFAVEGFGLFDAAITAVKCGQGKNRLADERERLLARAKVNSDPGEIRRGIADCHPVKSFGARQITLLLTNERQGLKQRDIKGALLWRASLDRQGIPHNAFSLHIFGTPEEMIGVYIL